MYMYFFINVQEFIFLEALWFVEGGCVHVIFLQQNLMLFSGMMQCLEMAFFDEKWLYKNGTFFSREYLCWISGNKFH